MGAGVSAAPRGRGGEHNEREDGHADVYIAEERGLMEAGIDAAERERAYLASLRPILPTQVAPLTALAAVGQNEHAQQRVLAAELLGERIVLAELEGRVVALRGTCPTAARAWAWGG